MDRNEAMDIACNLYDGGWRASDKDLLMEEYGITSEDAELICEALERIQAVN